MASRSESLGLGRRNTPQVRGTTQSVYMAHSHRFTQVACVQRRVMCMQTGAHTHIHRHRRAVNTCSQEIHAHTLTGRFVHTYVYIKGLPHIFIYIHM